MKVTTITYRRVIQVRPYESETLEFVAEVQEGEDPIAAAVEVKMRVNDCLTTWAEERKEPSISPNW